MPPSQTEKGVSVLSGLNRRLSLEGRQQLLRDLVLKGKLDPEKPAYRIILTEIIGPQATRPKTPQEIRLALQAIEASKALPQQDRTGVLTNILFSEVPEVKAAASDAMMFKKRLIPRNRRCVSNALRL